MVVILLPVAAITSLTQGQSQIQRTLNSTAAGQAAGIQSDVPPLNPAAVGHISCAQRQRVLAQQRATAGKPVRAVQGQTAQPRDRTCCCQRFCGEA